MRPQITVLSDTTLAVCLCKIFIIAMIYDPPCHSPFPYQNMVRVTPLLSAAFFSLAASGVVVAEFQQHLRDSSTFQDSCALIATSISSASAVYYPCQPLRSPPPSLPPPPPSFSPSPSTHSPA